MKSVLTAPMKESKSYQTICEGLRNLPSAVMAEGCTDSQKLHLIYALSQEDELTAHAQFRLILTYSELRARQIRDEYEFYDRSCTVFPAKDLIFYQADLHGKEIDKERMKTLRRILEGKPTTVVTTFAALMTPQIPPDILRRHVISVARRGTLDLERTAAALVSMGYEKSYQVERPGQFAVRGDILDVFDLTEENPYRIELWDDEVDSIRSFDVLSQRKIQELESAEIYPASEMILDGNRMNAGLEQIRKEAKKEEAAFREKNDPEAAHRLRTHIDEITDNARSFGDFGALEGYIHYFYPQTEGLLSLFPKDRTVLFFDEPVRIRQHAQTVEAEFVESMTARAEKGYVLSGQMKLLTDTAQIFAQTQAYRRLGVAGILTGCSFFQAQTEVAVHARVVAPYNKSFDTLRHDLALLREQGSRVLILSPSRTRAKRLAADLTADGITAFYSDNPQRVLKPGEIMTRYGRIARGFEYTDIRFTVIAESDIFGPEPKSRKKAKKKTHSGASIQDFSELKVGDYVVHEQYGIGIYRGVEKIEVDHIVKDYIKIEYAGGGTLYILPTELDVLQKYASSDAKRPKINKLGTNEWNKTKSRVRSAVAEVADDLVRLYSARQSEKGHAFGPDTVWQKEFEEMFPYEETEDQLAAIEDTKKDMESDKIMDRLICGDVGFGKTEIAIRAAFKAVQDGMQVAVLVPTTILAQQHFNNFQERMKNYPVNIEMMSRFRTSAEIKKTIEGLRSGRVDIVIGTHRILSNDVKFKNLGLLVIDEEQRFGVTHKEKIKKMKENVDVLTLSATPIPRTLHMSLVGIRDMSVLEEAPEDRVPIQTYVMEYDDEMVREAILRELSRHGQVYYVYNRVNDIDQVTDRIRQLVPEAKVAYAHGQMKESELERIMYSFINGEIDVLVSTTIIETGLDISNVNTIIIHDADRMGLSQLYQLRGRVGRSGRTAYAFLMYKRDRMLKEEAEKRLSAIREYTDLGSGFKIAMRDLEIRGAGNILGRSQHGHMQAVGYDLYCKLLNSAVQKAKGQETVEEEPVTVHLNVDAYIPDSYILNEEQKLEIYKRIAQITSSSDYDDVRDELKDRYGDIPAPAGNLLRIALIRSVAETIGLTDITGGDGEITFSVNPKARGIRAENIPLLIRYYRGALSFSAQGVPDFVYKYKPSGITVTDEEVLLSSTEEVLVAMAKYLRG